MFEINGIKREELIAAGSVILHEIYFDALGGEGGDPSCHDARCLAVLAFAVVATEAALVVRCDEDSRMRPGFASLLAMTCQSPRRPASRSSGRTVAMKYGNSSLKFTNETVVPANPTSLIRTISSAIMRGVPISG